MVYVVCGAEILLGSPFLGRHQHRFSIFQHADSVVDAQHFQFANSSCGRCCRAKQMQDRWEKWMEDDERNCRIVLISFCRRRIGCPQILLFNNMFNIMPSTFSLTQSGVFRISPDYGIVGYPILSHHRWFDTPMALCCQLSSVPNTWWLMIIGYYRWLYYVILPSRSWGLYYYHQHPLQGNPVFTQPLHQHALGFQEL